MKYLILLIVALIILTSPVGAEEPLYPLFVELNGEQLTLKYGENLYNYPANSEEAWGIKKFLKTDISGDKKDEYLLAVELNGYRGTDYDAKSFELPEAPISLVLVCDKMESGIGIREQIYVGHHNPDFELADINGDGIDDLIATGDELMHWKHMKIIIWQIDKFKLIWDKGSDDFIVSQSFGFNKKEIAQIKIGYPLHPEGGQGYEPEIWEIWSWDRNQFVKQ